MNNMSDNTWYKLRDGTWGAKIKHKGEPGDTVHLVNKKGEETQVWLVRRIAEFPDAQLWSCTTEQPEEEEAF